MDYKEAVSFIENLKGHDTDSNFIVMKELMHRLGNKHKNIKAVHVAGTNGKGSTCSMLASVLKKAGFKTGLFISPHLVKYTERFSINGIDMSACDFIKYVENIKNVVEEMKKSGFEEPSFFEALTAIGFCYFYDNNCDIVILEVGLGGRLDATNIIEKPLVSVITSISLDHTEILGDTVEKITQEKCGIIKYKAPVVLYIQQSVVYNIVKDCCFMKDCELFCPQNIQVQIIKNDVFGSIFNVETEYFKYENLEIKLAGEHQIKNCILVLTIVYALGKYGFSINKNNIYDGLKEAVWPGRLEVIDKLPLTIIDGAHNYDGIHILSETIKKLSENKKITLLMGVLKDKDYEKMAYELMPLVNKIVVTEPDYYRALDCNILFDIAKTFSNDVFVSKNLLEAYNISRNITDKDDIVICCGSLYLIGDLKKLLG